MGDAITSGPDGGTYIRVRVTPRARRDAIEGVQGDALRVRVTAPPVKGAANEAVIALLAERLHVPKRDVTLVRGANQRTKVVAVAGLPPEEVRKRLGLHT